MILIFSFVDPGIYKYVPSDHGLLPVVRGDKRRGLASACLNQSFIENAPAVLLVTEVVQRTEARYGSRAERYVFMEAGHLGQNVSLEAVSLGLSSVMVGAFDDEKVILALGGVLEEIPVYVIPFGYKND
ncbi:SagB/ThcOx family dehydrogenase [candidate division WOR-3 bacterium]|nr:SagB/ThcOx family dehydrogenase [candidate division WOR-3 bacterium]